MLQMKQAEFAGWITVDPDDNYDGGAGGKSLLGDEIWKRKVVSVSGKEEERDVMESNGKRVFFCPASERVV